MRYNLNLKQMKRLIFLQGFLCLLVVNLYSQTDSLIFTNGNYIVGEVKTMNKNVLTIETSYSDADFTIEWSGIKQIYTKTFFLITLTDGNRLNGQLKSLTPGKVSIVSDGETPPREVKIDDIVILDDIDQGFWSQIHASVDVGIDLTKANEFRQLSIRSNLGYIANRWQLDGIFNTLNSTQTDVENIKRTDGGVTYKYFLSNDWYPVISVEFLSNTELQLDLRYTSKLGLGKYVIHNNKLYWGFSLGANYNNENYSDDATPDRDSWEGFFSSELNLFNMGDLSLLTQLVAFPSFTESGRWRTDFTFDIKYDLPLDFYIKLGYTFNFDNQPAAGSPDTDYVFHCGFGWEW
jgi:hypothetical protein